MAPTWRQRCCAKGFDLGTYGFYVAETPDRVYIARPSITDEGDVKEGDRLLVFPRDDVVGISIGELTPVGDLTERQEALARGRRLLTELCDVKAPEVSAATSGDDAKPSDGAGPDEVAPCPPAERPKD